MRHPVEVSRRKAGLVHPDLESALRLVLQGIQLALRQSGRRIHGFRPTPDPHDTGRLVFYALLLGLAWLGFQIVPGGFIPTQDQGYAIIAAQLPDGASLERTDAVVRELTKRAREVEGIEHVVAFAGFNGATFANSPNAAALFPAFAPFDERKKTGRTGEKILADLRAKFADIQEAMILVIPPPSVRGIGSGGGFKLMLQDRANLGSKALEDAAMRLVVAANADPAIAQAFSPFRANSPRLFADVDRAKALMLDVPLENVFSAMQIYLGSVFVNELNLFGRTFRVTAQADIPFRDDPEDLFRLKTRNRSGSMVPLGSLVDLRETTGPDRFVRYNLFPAAEVQGAAARGYSTGQALAAMERLAAEVLPPGITLEWTELAYQEKIAGGTAGQVFILAIIFVFLVLVAQYENWSLPLAVILTVPLCLSGAIWFVLARGLDNNILTQIGLIVLIGLAAKNAILIVEFAKQKEDQGMDVLSAAAEAARLRLRPILMTSFRLHSRSASTRALLGCGRGDATFARCSSLWRDVECHSFRHFFHAGSIRRHSAADRAKKDRRSGLGELSMPIASFPRVSPGKVPRLSANSRRPPHREG